MALDTTVQPWISKMLMPADGRVMGAAINDFVQGAAQGYLARKADTRSSMLDAGETPAPPSGFERLVRLANPEQQMSVDQTLNKDLGSIGQEIGGLKTSGDIFDWVAKNAALSASPIGSRILTQIQGTGKQMAMVEAESAGHIAAVELAKDKARLMVKYGLGPDATPIQFGNARANENEESFTQTSAMKLGKDVSGLITPQDFDTNGNWIPGAQQRILKSAPRSEGLLSKEMIAGNHDALMQQRDDMMERHRKIMEDLAAGRTDLVKSGQELRGIEQNLRLIDLNLKANAVGYQITNPPAVGPAAVRASMAMGQNPDIGPPVAPVAPPPAPTLTQVERPLTTQTTGSFQKQSAQIDTALPLLDTAFNALEQTPDAFGPIGLGKSILEKGKGVLDPTAETPIAKARAQADLAFTKLAPTLRMDSGNMSRYERNRLEGLGDALDWTKPANVIQTQLRNLYDASVAQRLRLANQLHQTVPDDLLLRIPQDQLIELKNNRLLTAEAAGRWYDLHKAK